MAKWTVEEINRLEASVIAERLRDIHDCPTGQEFVITRGDKKLASGTLYLNRMELRYSFRTQSCDQWRQVIGGASFDWTYPNYGGRRLWFRCPYCGRRVRVLFMFSTLACRHCLDLQYALQQESRGCRGWGMRDRICNRLGGDPMNPKRPKGMHWKTYGRLVDRMQELTAMRGMQFLKLYLKGSVATVLSKIPCKR